MLYCVGTPYTEKKPSMEEIPVDFFKVCKDKTTTLENLVQTMAASVQNLASTVASHHKAIQHMDAKMEQLVVTVNSIKISHVSNSSEVRPREQCNVVTLRSGKPLMEPVMKEKLEVEKPENAEKNIEEERKNVSKMTCAGKSPTLELLHVEKLPYPQQFQKKKLNAQFSQFLDMFKKLHINIPFVEILEHMPNYVKFMKNVLSKETKFEQYEIVNLTKECCVILQKKLPQKLKDSGSFTIPCTIGSLFVKKVLCDLGASIILMHLSVYKNLGLKEVESIIISL